MKTLVESLNEALINEAKLSFDSNFEATKSAVLQGADTVIKFLNSPSKLNKYFNEFNVEKGLKKNVYNILAGLASDLYEWMTNIDDMGIEEDSDMVISFENYSENLSDDYEDEEISAALPIWPKLWKDVTKQDWVW